MPATTISNPRDLVVRLLGELLFVERRLADTVLGDLVRVVHDEELQAVLRQHRDETEAHVDRVEQAFRRLGVSVTSNLSRTFESAVAEHADVAAAIVEPHLADIFHAQAALHVEHWEMATYRTLLPLAPDDVRALLRPTFAEEGEAAKLLVRAVDRLGDAERGRR